MSFIDELKRRNVIRVGAAYAVSAWILLQVLDVLGDLLELPPWGGRIILLILIAGFFVTLFVAWAYELTPEGIKPESELARDPSLARSSGRRLDRAILVALLIAVAYLAYDKLAVDDTPDAAAPKDETGAPVAANPDPEALVAEPAIDPASIAVLPFADLSPNGDQGHFSDGIAEEILNVLVRVDGLAVASRTSAFGFKGQLSQGIPAIAETLKVRHVLEGSVRKSGDQIRITAQLIDGRTDKHLWSQTYDRVLTAENLFAIQDEIARSIVDMMADSMPLEPVQPSRTLVTVATESLDAYDLYLKARSAFHQRNTANIPGTIAMYEQAIELDPDYAEAWAGLAAVSLAANPWGVEGRDFIDLAETAARRAMELDDSLALPYAVLGSLGPASLVPPINFRESFEFYDLALERDPNSATTLLWRGIAHLAVGRFEAAARDLERCLLIEPLYENCRKYLALVRLSRGETQTAFELFEKATARGGMAVNANFAFAYITEGQPTNGLFLLAIMYQRTDSGPISAEMVFRALTEPGYDAEGEWRRFLLGFEARTGRSFTVEEEEDLGTMGAIAHGQYDLVRAEIYEPYWWHLGPELLPTTTRKRLINEIGVHDYWREAGFPPQCRPVGADDFECD